MANKSTFKLSDFKASIKSRGVSRGTRFELIIHPPLIVSGGIDSKEISIRCNTGSLPPMNIKTKDYVVGQGQIRKMPVGYDQGHTLPFTFYNDTRSFVYDGLLQWSKAVLASQDVNEYAINYFNEFVGTLEVRQLDEQDNIRFSYMLFDVYPTKVEAVSLDSSHVNDAQTIKVEFSYRYARSLDEMRNDEEKNNPTARESVKQANGEYASRSRGYEGVTTASGQYQERNRSYDAAAEADPSMIFTAKRNKGEGTSPLQAYNKCMSFIADVRAKGEGLEQAQIEEWGPIQERLKGEMDAARASGDTSALGGLWSNITDVFTNLSGKVSGFFADTKTANQQYVELAPNLTPADPIHGNMTELKATYSSLATSQTAINSDYYTMNKDLNKLLNPTVITVNQG